MGGWTSPELRDEFKHLYEQAIWMFDNPHQSVDAFAMPASGSTFAFVTEVCGLYLHNVAGIAG